MNAPDPDRYRRAVANQRGPARVGVARRLHQILQEQRMANEPQAQQAANAPPGRLADPNALAAEFCQHVQRAGQPAPAGAQAAPVNWGTMAPTPDELDQLKNISQEAVAFIMKFALARVGAVFGG